MPTVSSQLEASTIHSQYSMTRHEPSIVSEITAMISEGSGLAPTTTGQATPSVLSSLNSLESSPHSSPPILSMSQSPHSPLTTAPSVVTTMATPILSGSMFSHPSHSLSPTSYPPFSSSLKTNTPQTLLASVTTIPTESPSYLMTRLSSSYSSLTLESSSPLFVITETLYSLPPTTPQPSSSSIMTALSSPSPLITELLSSVLQTIPQPSSSYPITVPPSSPQSSVVAESSFSSSDTPIKPSTSLSPAATKSFSSSFITSPEPSSSSSSFSSSSSSSLSLSAAQSSACTVSSASLLDTSCYLSQSTVTSANLDQTPTPSLTLSKPVHTLSPMPSTLLPTSSNIGWTSIFLISIASTVYLGILIGIVIFLIICIYYMIKCGRKNEKIVESVKIEEIPMTNTTSIMSPVIESHPEYQPVWEAPPESLLFQGNEFDIQPEEVLAYDSLRPIPPPPSHITPRSSVRLSNIAQSEGKDESDYFPVEDLVLENRFSDYTYPIDNIGVQKQPSVQSTTTVQSVDPYDDDAIDGELSRISQPPSHPPPPPPTSDGLSRVESTVSELPDSHDYDYVYTETLEPSMLGKAATIKSNALPYAPVYEIPKGKPVKAFHISAQNVRLLKELGSGHFGKVYLASTLGVSLKDMKLSEDSNRERNLLVAVKLLKPCPSRSMMESFQTQINFMSRLKHANVIRLLAVSTSETPFMVMEYMENGDLHNFLQKQELQPETISALGPNEVTPMILLYISVQIASAMRYLSSKKFIHRDLATRNCLIGRDFVVKISDFGMSHTAYHSSYFHLTSHLILPIRWMPTETFYGKFSVKSDSWAFGVTIWEVFTLCRVFPYAEMDDADVIQDALKGKTRKVLNKPPACPREVYEVMQRCFVFQPIMRADFEEIYSRIFGVYSRLCDH